MHDAVTGIVLQPLVQIGEPCMLSQSFGVSHMKLAGDGEFRSLMSWQSVLTQPEGSALTIIEQRAVLLVMSWN